MALDTNLVAYWKLDGNSNDALGTYNGTDTNVTYASGNGIINQGANITGTAGDGIVVADNAVFDAGSVKTCSAWFKWDTQTSNDIIIGKYGDFATGANYQNGWFFQSVSGTGFRVACYNDAGVGFTHSATTQPSNGSWTHAVIQIDTANSLLKFYVNGSKVGSDLAISGTFTFNNTSNLWFGKSVGDMYDGSIDEVGIWSRVLSDAEITQLYNGGAGLAYPFVTGNSRFLAFF